MHLLSAARSAEATLMARVARQDRAAFSALYDAYAGVSFALAFKILGSVEEAEEVVLDVFCQLWQRARDFEPRRAPFGTWLLVITRSRSLDRLRALERGARARIASEERVWLSERSTQDPETATLVAERGRQVRTALAALPEAQRRLLELAYYEGLSQSEITALTDLPLGTVKTRIRAGLLGLRAALPEV